MQACFWKKDKTGLLSTITVIMTVLCTISVNAAYTTTITNNFHTGMVDIELENLSHNENGILVSSDSSEPITTDSDGALLGPNSNINRTMEVSNLADNCWVRAKVKITSDDLDQEHLDSMEINMPDKNWNLCKDGWYYYTKPLKPHTNTILYDNIHLPSSWGNEVANKSFLISVDANAIQEKNFTPDFNSEDPWKTAEIQDTVRTLKGNTYDEEVSAEKGFLKIVYENDAEQYVKVSKNFGDDIGTMMPGDTITKSIDLVNNSNHPEAIYFRTENPMNDDLAKIIKVTLKMNDTVLYYGSLYDLTKNREIVNLDRGRSEELFITIEFPSEMDNQYENLNISTIWYFQAKDISTGHLIRNLRSPNTGVSTNIICYAIAGVIALIVLILLAVIKKKGKNNGNRKKQSRNKRRNN